MKNQKQKQVCEHSLLYGSGGATCDEVFNCCDCGNDGDHNGCGCAYCWSCNACDTCKKEN